MQPAPFAMIDRLDALAGRYDALLCDLWGCLHDGVRPFPEAVAALQAFRAGGGAVALLTNAPRPPESVAAQLARLGAPEDVRDVIVSSGEATRAAVMAGGWGPRVHHIGPERDLDFFAGLPVEIAPLAEADSVICTGLRDDEAETPDDYADELREAQLRRLPMLCANPDIVVHRGGREVFCAGAVARAFAAIGGAVTACGKPHAPIYDLAMRRLEEALGRPVDSGRVLAVGDGIATDIAGAVNAGFDSLFVAGGIAAAETFGPGGAPDPARLAAFFAVNRATPTHVIDRLR